MAPINRRAFLLRAAPGLGAASVICCGLGTAGQHAPANPDYAYTFLSKGSIMNQKILVAYASRAGSTVEVAQFVAKELVQRSYSVDVRPVKQVAGLNGYSGVVVGSAVRMGSWLPEAVKFVETSQAVLGELRTAFFAVHLMNLGDDETSRKARLAYLAAILHVLAIWQDQNVRS